MLFNVGGFQTASAALKDMGASAAVAALATTPPLFWVFFCLRRRLSCLCSTRTPKTCLAAPGRAVADANRMARGGPLGGASANGCLDERIALLTPSRLQMVPQGR